MIVDGRTISGRAETGKVWMDGHELTASEGFKLRSHSQSFTWGDFSPPAAQLSLAILLKLTSKEKALLLYQDFKHAFTSKWKGDFEEPLQNIREWVDSKNFGVETYLEINSKKKTTQTKGDVHEYSVAA